MPKIAALALLAALWAGAAQSQTVTVVCTQGVGGTCQKWKQQPPLKPGFGGGFNNPAPVCEQMSAPTHYACTIQSDKPIAKPTRVTLQK
jgi:hypothetical protein